MRHQAGVVDAGDLRVLGQPLRDGLCIGRVPFHPHRQRFRSAQHEPSVEWTRHASSRVLEERDARAKLLVVAGESSADDIGMPAQVLGRRVQDDVRPKPQRLLQVRTRERVVDHGQRLAPVRDLRESRDVEHFQERIRRRLDPDELRARAQRAPRGFGLAHVDRRQRHAQPIEDSGEQAIRPAVDVVGHDDVIALREEMCDRVGCGHPGGEGESPATTLQSREAGLERRSRGITGAGVLVAFVLTDRFLREGRGLKDGNDHSPGDSFGILPGVYGERLKSELAGSVLHGSCQYAENRVRTRRDDAFGVVSWRSSLTRARARARGRPLRLGGRSGQGPRQPACGSHRRVGRHSHRPAARVRASTRH